MAGHWSPFVVTEVVPWWFCELGTCAMNGDAAGGMCLPWFCYGKAAVRNLCPGMGMQLGTWEVCLPCLCNGRAAVGKVCLWWFCDRNGAGEVCLPWFCHGKAAVGKVCLRWFCNMNAAGEVR